MDCWWLGGVVQSRCVHKGWQGEQSQQADVCMCVHACVWMCVIGGTHSCMHVMPLNPEEPRSQFMLIVFRAPVRACTRFVCAHVSMCALRYFFVFSMAVSWCTSIFILLFVPALQQRH